MMKDASNLLGKKNVVIFGDSSKLKLFIIIFFVINPLAPEFPFKF